MRPAEFLQKHREAIERAGRAIEDALNKRGYSIQTSTATLVALNACMAFSNEQ